MSDGSGGFLGVFEQRVHRLRKRLKDELEKEFALLTEND